MKNTVGNFLAAGSLFSLLLIVASCAGTTVSETQVDRTYKGEPVSNILVIAVTGNEHNRRSSMPPTGQPSELHRRQSDAAD